MPRGIPALLLAVVVAAFALPPASADVMLSVSVHETADGPATTRVTTCSFYVSGSGLLETSGTLRIFREGSPPVEVASVAFHATPIGHGLYATVAGPVHLPGQHVGLYPVFDHATEGFPDVSIGPTFAVHASGPACVQTPTTTWPCTISSFLPPIGTPGHTLENGVQRFKHGQTIPVKMNVVCPDGAPASAPKIMVAMMEGATLGAEKPATSKSGGYAENHMRRNGNHWHYNLDTNSMAKGLCQIRVDVGDGHEHSVMALLK